MTIAQKLTNYGEIDKVQAYWACEEHGVKSEKNEGVLYLNVFTFSDGSFVEFAEAGYWVYNS